MLNNLAVNPRDRLELTQYRTTSPSRAAVNIFVKKELDHFIRPSFESQLGESTQMLSFFRWTSSKVVSQGLRMISISLK